jgi:two-component system, chemotaxis family, response regulator Rcp1
MGRSRVITILIVEDSPAYLYLTQKAFRDRRGEIEWKLTTAEDGEQAIALLFTEEKVSAPLPDLIFLDWNLPKMSGSEVLQRIKGHLKLLRIPVIVFSASEASEDIHEAYGHHANGYITKPGNLDLLAVMVEAMERFWAVTQLPKVVR